MLKHLKSWVDFFTLQINQLLSIGIDETVTNEDSRRIVINNYLGIVSALLLSPFPIIFLLLDIPEGLYLCAIGVLAIVVPFTLNYFRLFFWSRVIGPVLGFSVFVVGILFFGYNAGFVYGFIPVLIFPIIGFKDLDHRIFVYSILIGEIIVCWIIFRDQIPIFYEPANKAILSMLLFISCTLLTILDFSSFDWISKSYEKKNIQLVEKLTAKNEELKNFSYSTSHDLKQPLRTILNFISLIQQKKVEQLDEEGKVYLNFISNAATRLDNLIDGLLEHSVLGQDEHFEWVDTDALVDEVLLDLNAQIEEHQATIHRSELPVIIGHKQEIRMVFQNLISNGIKFKKQNTSPIIYLSGITKEKHWEFSIEDNGIGIDPSLQGKIFQIFKKGHLNPEIEGTGIGLANCKKIITHHLGDVWVESQSGLGSTFYFTIKKGLPIKKKATD